MIASAVAALSTFIACGFLANWMCARARRIERRRAALTAREFFHAQALWRLGDRVYETIAGESDPLRPQDWPRGDSFSHDALDTYRAERELKEREP